MCIDTDKIAEAKREIRNAILVLEGRGMVAEQYNGMLVHRAAGLMLAAALDRLNEAVRG
jgi:hypothetical protein